MCILVLRACSCQPRGTFLSPPWLYVTASPVSVYMPAPGDSVPGPLTPTSVSVGHLYIWVLPSYSTRATPGSVGAKYPRSSSSSFRVPGLCEGTSTQPASGSRRPLPLYRFLKARSFPESCRCFLEPLTSCPTYVGSSRHLATEPRPLPSHPLPAPGLYLQPYFEHVTTYLSAPSGSS